MIWRTGLASWEFEFPFPGILTSTFLVLYLSSLSAAPQRRPMPPLPSPRMEEESVRMLFEETFGPVPPLVRKFFIDNLLVRIHFVIVVIRWTGLAPGEFKRPVPGILTSTFLVLSLLLLSAARQRCTMPPLPSPRPRVRTPALRKRPGAHLNVQPKRRKT